MRFKMLDFPTPELPVKTLMPPENSLFNCGEIEKTLTDSAFSGFARAKKLHDELEEIYKRAMDFDALTAFTDVYINSLFA